MAGKAHPDDVLIVAWFSEAAEWPEFDSRRQVIPITALWQARGRRFRHVYVTTPAIWQPEAASLDVLRWDCSGEIRSANDWRPEPEPSKWQQFRKGLLNLCERFA